MSPKDRLDRELAKIKSRNQWSVQELARHLDCPAERIEELVRSGTIKARREGGTVVIDSSSLSIDIIQTEELRQMVLAASDDSPNTSTTNVESALQENPPEPSRPSTNTTTESNWVFWLATVLLIVLAATTALYLLL